MYSLDLEPTLFEEVICEYEKLKCKQKIKNTKTVESLDIRLPIIFADIKYLQALRPKA